MSKTVKYVIGGLIIFGIFLCILIFSGNFVIDCLDIPLRKASSSDALSNAVLFQRECQSTETYELHLNIHEPGSEVFEGFSIGPVVTTNLELRWESPTTLEIIYPDDVTPPPSPRFLNDIKVLFKQRQDTSN